MKQIQNSLTWHILECYENISAHSAQRLCSSSILVVLVLLTSFFLPITSYAGDLRTVARTLRVNKSVAIYSHQCKLSTQRNSDTRVLVKCSKKIRHLFQDIPIGKPYLGPEQKALIKGRRCYLDVRINKPGKVKIKCVAFESSTPTPTPSPSPTVIPLMTIGGTINGLIGTVVLQNNGTDDLSSSSNGSFTFSTPLQSGEAYNVTISVHPANQTCSVTNGSGTVGGSNVTDISVDCLTDTTSLATSVANLALSVTGLTEFGVSGTPDSGLARTFTVTNTGSSSAMNLNIMVPTLPAGTTSETTCGSTLAASASCTVTITPGATASSDGSNPCDSSGTTPVSDSILISADNADSVSTNIVVLGYGCIYQGGHVFALDDSTPNTESVGGKVMATTDQAAPLPNGIIWSSNGGTGNGSGGSDLADTSRDLIPGINDLSTSSSGSPSYANFVSFFNTYTNPNPFTSASFAACDGATDGNCNTSNILTFYNQFITNNTSANGGTGPFTASPGPTDTTYYAAGLCTQTISSYSDWYLPAICELGYGSDACGDASTPVTQNAQSSLVEFNSLNLLAGGYQSSTQYSSSPENFIWTQGFSSSVSDQSFHSKASMYGVRCVRALTNDEVP